MNVSTSIIVTLFTSIQKKRKVPSKDVRRYPVYTVAFYVCNVVISQSSSHVHHIYHMHGSIALHT